jgi:hypothetical protein
MIHDIDTVTDRWARRNTPWGLERDTYAWALLRLNIAGRRAQRAVVLGLIPAVKTLGATMERADQSLRRLGEAMRP